MTSGESPGSAGATPPPEVLDRPLAETIYADAVARYMAERRRRLPDFVGRHFGLRGTLRTHRKALGWDLARAPANLLLAVPFVATRLAGGAVGLAGRRSSKARAVADRLSTLPILLRTDVEREIEWLVYTELLELPIRQEWRESRVDALAEALLSDPRLTAVARAALGPVAGRLEDPEARGRLRDMLETYTGSRAAASEIATALAATGLGAAAFHQVTPGALSLGPAVAGVIAHQAALASFPLGASLGGLWYGLFPVAPSAALVAGVTGAVMAGAALVAAFAGVLADPLQRVTGLHRRRLRRLLDGLETELRGRPGRFVVRDHYVARLIDLIDVIRAAARII